MPFSLVPFLLLLACATLNAAPLTVQSAIYTAKLDGAKSESVVYSVPIVRASDPAIAARINAAFADDAKGRAIETKTVAGDDRLYLSDAAVERIKQTAASLDYAIERNDGRVLTISIEGEYCGAYCENSTKYFSFDAGNGQRLTLASLFTPGGIATLGKRIAALRVASINRQIARLKSGNTDGLLPEDAETAIDMYQRCTGLRAEPDLESEPYLGYDELNIGVGTLTFVHGRCSPHVIRALDELGEFQTSFALAELKPYLNDFGKTLLLGYEPQSGPASPLSKVLHGRIGARHRITMSLELGGNDYITGNYFYDKYRIPIPIAGHRHGTTVVLTEIESSESPQPTMTLSIDGSKLKGTWKGKTSLDFEAAP